MQGQAGDGEQRGEVDGVGAGSVVQNAETLTVHQLPHTTSTPHFSTATPPHRKVDKKIAIKFNMDIVYHTFKHQADERNISMLPWIIKLKRQTSLGLSTALLQQHALRGQITNYKVVALLDDHQRKMKSGIKYWCIQQLRHALGPCRCTSIA